jgi:hypothetical protein
VSEIRTDQLDAQTVEMLEGYRAAGPAKRQAFLRMLQRVAEREMTMAEAGEQYCVELGLSEDEARRLVAAMMGDEPRGFV